MRPPDQTPETTDHTPDRASQPSVGIAMVLVGIALVLLPGSLDGVVGGLAQGSGIALALLGVAVTARTRGWWGNLDGDAAWWLPSRTSGEPRSRTTDGDAGS